MKKRINLTKLSCFTLLITMIALILVSGTYAKYSSNASGTDATVVAKWSFMVNGEDITTTDNNSEIEFNLFNTIYDSNGVDEEKDVAPDLIAPGTSGSFEFILQNKSDVTARYGINFEEENENNIPIQYSLDGNEWVSDISDINIRESDDTVLAIGSSEKSVIVMWKWVFDGDSTKDTELGVLEQASIKIKAIVTASQINYVYLEKLEQKYDLSYYGDMGQAIAVINSSSYDDTSLTTTKEQASAAVYLDENNIPNIYIIKDASFDTGFEVTTDMILNLGGRTLKFNSENAINVTSGNVVIDGTFEGSKIYLTNDSQKTTIAQVNNGSLKLNGGVYETLSNGIGTDADPNSTILVGSTGELVVEDAEILAEDSNGGTLVGILVENGGKASVTNSNVEITSLNGLKSDAIRSDGEVTIIESNVVAYANHAANAAGNDYGMTSRGISNNGTMILKDSYVYGAHSGIRSLGTLYIDGGTYEGYGHGGIYFAGADTTSYVKNATVQYADMQIGEDDGRAGTNGAGFYIGGASNVTVYMDNTNISGPLYPMVLRSSGREANNSLYISNSNINEDRTKYPRNDGSTNKIYIGSGNNFGVLDTYKESGSVETNVDYSSMFPEY